MSSVTLSPHMRIVALVGVLLIALGGSAFFVLHGHSKPVTPIATTPMQHPTTHPTTPPPRVHVVRPTVDRLLPTPLRNALKRDAFVVVGFYNPDYPVTRHTIAEARAAKEARAKRAERAQALVASTPLHLREAVVKLFKEGRRIEAFKHYSSVSGEDLATAKEVVELLAAQAR